jgi:hypothetical protein
VKKLLGADFNMLFTCSPRIIDEVGGCHAPRWGPAARQANTALSYYTNSILSRFRRQRH